MKKRFLKTSLAVLSTVCLMASGSIKAMQDDGAIMEEQHKAFAKSMFIDVVIKNENFDLLLQEYQKLSLDLDEESASAVYDLQAKMKEIYLGYVEKCRTENVSPFCPLGVLRFLSSEIQEPTTNLSFSEEIEHLSLKMRKNPFFPEVDPVKMFGIINDILYPKYSPLKPGAKYLPSPINQGGSEKEGLKFFLLDKDVDLISDPNLMVILLRMLVPLPETVKSCSIIQNPRQLQNVQFPFSGSFMLGSCLRIEDHKFSALKVSKSFFKFQESLGSIWISQDSEKNSAVQQKVSEHVIDELNKMFFVSGKQCYDIAQHVDLLAKNLQDWLNIMRKLVKFERQEWKELGSDLRKLRKDYNAAFRALSSSQNSYSGVSVGACSISLNLAAAVEEAKDSSILIKLINKHYKTYEDQLSRFEHVESSLPALKKIQKWLEDVYEFIAKKGNLS